MFALNLISISTNFAQGLLFTNTKHINRFKICAILGILAFLLISIATYEGSLQKEQFFYMAIFASCLIGMSVSMGEATFLSFINGFPSHMVGYVSSGTGFGGISGTASLLLLQSLGLSNQIIFLIVTPTYFLFFYSAYWLNQQKLMYPYI